MSEIADRFTAALGEIERNDNLEPMLQLFDEDAVAYNPVYLQGLRGRDGVRRFWQEYRDFFASVESRFTRRLDCDSSVVVLEWVAEARLRAGGEPFQYGGVTLLTHDGQHVTKFNSYYDSAQLPPLQVQDPSTGLQTGEERR
jgi:hypothetical protein